MKKVSRLLVRTYDAALTCSPMNITQHAVIQCISRRAGEPLSRVAEELEMDRSSLYRAIAPMVRDGWLDLTTGVNARSRSAKLTTKGLSALATTQIEVDRVQDRLLNKFGNKAFASLVAELNRLADCADGIEEDMGESQAAATGRI